LCPTLTISWPAPANAFENQFADLSVCANQNKFHKNSILVSDLRIYLFTLNLGAKISIQSLSLLASITTTSRSLVRARQPPYLKGGEEMNREFS